MEADEEWAVIRHDGAQPFGMYGKVLWRGHGKVLVETSGNPPPIDWTGEKVFLHKEEDVKLTTSRGEASTLAQEWSSASFGIKHAVERRVELARSAWGSLGNKPKSSTSS